METCPSRRLTPTASESSRVAVGNAEPLTSKAAGSIEYARETALDLVASGKANLEVLPHGEPKVLLAAIADYLVEREY